MNIYEIDDAIRQMIEQELAIDEETGEITGDLSKLDELQMLREQKIENAACYYKNLIAESKAIRDEEKALATRRKSIEKQADRLTGYLKYALNGERFTSPRAQVTFRRATSAAVDDEFIEWAEKNNPDLLRYKDPEPNKKAITDLLKAGEAIPHASLQDSVSMTVK